MSSDTGTIVTVDGPIEPESAGITYPHEHLFANWEEKFDPPEAASKRRFSRETLSLENRWFVRRKPYGVLDNLRLESVEDAVHEVRRFHRAGGDTMVEVTPKNTGMDPEAVRGVSRETGINVVKGTSFYYYDAHPSRVSRMSEAEIADEFVSDVREGIDDTTVRAGIVGEIGLSDAPSGQWHDQEEKVLRAGARAALRTGASVSIHPPAARDPESPPSVRALEVLDVCTDVGLPAERVVIGHMDQSKWADAGLDAVTDLASRGAFVEFDLFGHERYMFGEQDAQLSDWERVEQVIELVERGYGDRLVLSQDIYLKHWLSKYGGVGWTHILETIVPALLDRGLDQDAVDRMLVENPAQILTFEAPED